MYEREERQEGKASVKTLAALSSSCSRRPVKHATLNTPQQSYKCSFFLLRIKREKTRTIEPIHTRKPGEYAGFSPKRQNRNVFVRILIPNSTSGI